MQVTTTTLPGVLLLEPRVFADERGCFFETWRAERYDAQGIGTFVQDNVSVSRRGVLRGLHCQEPNAQGKLVTVLHGRVFDVAVDVRHGSPHFGRWFGVELDPVSARQLWIPPGFAHGFLALEDNTVFSYKCTDVYAPASEFSVRWDDPAIGITWPEAPRHLSPKDAAAPLLADLPADRLPRWATDASA